MDVIKTTILRDLQDVIKTEFSSPHAFTEGGDEIRIDNQRPGLRDRPIEKCFE